MKANIQSIHFDADKKLLEFIQNKIEKLTQFFDAIIDADVFLKLEKSKDKDTGNKIVEIKINVPSTNLLAKEQCKTFEEAVDLCVDALRKQIIKYKEKLRD